MYITKIKQTILYTIIITFLAEKILKFHRSFLPIPDKDFNKIIINCVNKMALTIRLSLYASV